MYGDYVLLVLMKARRHETRTWPGVPGPWSVPWWVQGPDLQFPGRAVSLLKH